MQFIRCLVAGFLGLVAGGATGCGLSCIFISTPLQRVLGPRYAEFDVLGVIGVTILGAMIAGAGATVAAAQGANKLRSTFTISNLIRLVLVPILAALLLTFFVSGEFAWLGLAYLSACSGILAGAGSALLMSRTASKFHNNGENRAAD